MTNGILFAFWFGLGMSNTVLSSRTLLLLVSLGVFFLVRSFTFLFNGI